MNALKIALVMGIAATMAACQTTNVQDFKAKAELTAKNTVTLVCAEYPTIVSTFDEISSITTLPNSLITARNTAVSTLGALCSRPITNYLDASIQIVKAYAALSTALKTARNAG